ncbi:MAG: HAD hydrolase-like protein [Gemmataceae bacterium]|nr:HAD hydrolase-like protein [Gemmataceae bacterium]
MNHDVRAVIFDAVGTLIHPAEPPARTYAAVAARHGIALDEAEIARRFRAAFRAEEERDRAADWVTSEAREFERWRNIVSATLGNASCFPQLWDHFAQPEAWTVDPNAAAVFDALRDRGLVLGLASNFDQRLLRIVNSFQELTPLKRNVVVSSQVRYRKPSGYFFSEIVGILNGVTPECVVYVGDDLENDYRGACAMGMRAILLDPHGLHPEIDRIGLLKELTGRFNSW